MIDGVGNVSSVLVVGAANPLCLATVDRLVGPRLSRVYALDSNPDSLSRGAQRIADFGVPNVSQLWYPSRDPVAQRAAVTSAFEESDVDVIVIGPSPRTDSAATDATAIEDNAEYLERALIDIVNLAGQCATSIAQQGHGVMTLFSHSPRKIPANLDHDYCAAMASLHILAPSIAQVTASNGGKAICAAIDPVRDPNSTRDVGVRSSAMSPLEVASEIVPAIVARRKRRTFEVISLPRSLRKSALRIRPGR